MGLTTAMYTGLSGLNVNQTRINTIGHNIANVNTHSFKSARTLFQTQFSHLLSAGNGPTATSGGVNPLQVGLGASVAATQKNHAPGSIEATGVPSDMAIDGSGFFILRRGENETVYTRDGAFALDEQNRLVSVDGHAVQGFGIDENFNVMSTVLNDLTIPLGTLTLAQSTTGVVMDGDLSSAGTIATQGSRHQSQALVSGGGASAVETTALSDLRSATDPNLLLFANGDTITVSGVDQGDREMPARSFVIGTDGTTLGDFATWLQTAIGIQDVNGVPGDPGVLIQNGMIVINSNAGGQNGLTINATDLVSTNSGIAVPFAFSETQSANGSGLRTSFTVYDSLGTPVVINMTLAMEQKAATGNTWRFYLEDPSATGATRLLGTGTVTFDTIGNFQAVTGNQVSVDRGGTGALSPMTFDLDFSGIHGFSTQASSVIMDSQDGFPPGTLTSYSVGNDGTLNGSFSNGMTQTLGQVALAMMPNAAGLLAESDNLYMLGPNSGEPTVTPPGLFGAGHIQGRSLELSNVDLSGEFIGLITSSTGFQAASRVISTSSDMLDQLLLIVR